MEKKRSERDACTCKYMPDDSAALIIVRGSLREASARDCLKSIFLSLRNREIETFISIKGPMPLLKR